MMDVSIMSDVVDVAALYVIAFAGLAVLGVAVGGLIVVIGRVVGSRSRFGR